jgi:prevent-host-death family protein
MNSVSVAELKSKLSQYLTAVKKGKELIVTSHQHPIARLVPLDRSDSNAGILPATKPVSSLKKIKGLSLKFDPVEFLLEDRRRR